MRLACGCGGIWVTQNFSMLTAGGLGFHLITSVPAKIGEGCTAALGRNEAGGRNDLESGRTTITAMSAPVLIVDVAGTGADSVRNLPPESFGGRRLLEKGVVLRLSSRSRHKGRSKTPSDNPSMRFVSFPLSLRQSVLHANRLRYGEDL